MEVCRQLTLKSLKRKCPVGVDQNKFIAPNLVLSSDLVYLGIFLQLSAAVLMPFSVALSGFFIVLIAFLSMFLFSPSIAIDYFFEVLGLGIAIILIAPSVCRLDVYMLEKYKLNSKYLKNLAVNVLRICLGLQLMILAVHNKFMMPGAGVLFLEQFSNFNFMQEIGLESFTHLHFVFAAGLFEGVFGLLLCAGIAIRFVSLTLVFMFTTTGILLGAEELLGHLPIVIAIIIILCHGSPSKSWVNNKHRQDLKGKCDRLKIDSEDLTEGKDI